MKDIRNIDTVVVHGGAFHADDALIVALFRWLTSDRVKVERVFKVPEKYLDNPKVLVADIGGQYDPDKMIFDHHQVDTPAMDDEGHKHAAIGLVLGWLGIELDDKTSAIIRRVEMIDNGYGNPATTPATTEEEKSADEAETKREWTYTLNSFVKLMNPLWDEKASVDDQFKLTTDILKDFWDMAFVKHEVDETIFQKCFERRLGEYKASKERAKEITEEALSKMEGRLVVLPIFVPTEDILPQSEAEFVVFPSNRGGYNLQAVPVEAGSFQVKHELPNWGVDVDKPEGMSFLYGAGDSTKIRWLSSFDTLENAIKAAKLIGWEAV